MITFFSNVPRTLWFPLIWLGLQHTVELRHLMVRCLDLQRPRVLFFQAFLARHKQSGRRNASPPFCEWCFCGSSSAGHDSTSRSSFLACSYTGPTASPPGGYKRNGYVSSTTSEQLREWDVKITNAFCLQCLYVCLCFSWTMNLTSAGSDILNSQPSPVQLMKVWQAESSRSSRRNCQSWMGPDPDGQKLYWVIHLNKNKWFSLCYDKYVCFKSFYNNASPG